MELNMKLSTNTMDVLKNYANINSGLYFKKGNVLRTVSSQKTILAEATIDDSFPQDFGIYELNTFLSVVSLSKEVPEFEFEDKLVKIVSNKGRSKIKYRYCEPTMIKTPPEKNIVLPTPEITLALSEEDFTWVNRVASVLSSPHIAIESDGTDVCISTLDLQNDAAHSDSLQVATGNGDVYRIIFKTENLSKVITGAYDVQISSKGLAHFKNKTRKIEYWLATESGSKFEGA